MELCKTGVMSDMMSGSESVAMSLAGQSLQGRPNGKSGHVRYATESGSKLMALAALRLAIAS